jgi:hypothetical protein
MTLLSTSTSDPVLLIGDNPFLGISHLSQERAKERGSTVTNAAHAGELVGAALANGADGFLFSVSDTSLAILSSIGAEGRGRPMALYPIAPFAYEYVRAAVKLGGLPGLAKEVGARIARSRNLYAISLGLSGAVRNDVGSLYKAYASYEASRVNAAAGPDARVASFLLHELVTDMALGLGMDWLFRAHLEFNRRSHTRAGYNTRNLPLLVQRFGEWGISLDGAVIAAPFNAEGFQMCPSRDECERVLADLEGTQVIAFSVLAAGHLDYVEAIDYVVGLPNLGGVAVGVSKLEQARTTFTHLRASLGGVAA